MNYSHIYTSLIDNARAQNRSRSDDTYYEAHHITPKCLGGSNDSDNLVLLKADEHFLAHQLLVKMNPGIAKLVYALNQMQTVNPYQSERTTNKKFKWIREKYAKTVATPEERQRHSATLKDAWSKWSPDELSAKNKGAWDTLRSDPEKVRQHKENVGKATTRNWNKKTSDEQKAITAKKQAWKNDPVKVEAANEKRREFWRKKREEKLRSTET